MEYIETTMVPLQKESFVIEEESLEDVSENSFQNPFTDPEYLKSVFGWSPKVHIEIVPHPLKAAKGGEDAYFVSETPSGLAFGVADGVGGWSSQGVDPSLVSKGLMRGAKIGFEKLKITDPVELMNYGHRQIENVTGTSTALIIVITEKGKKLHAANLGDSGFMVTRNGELLFKSTEMQHYFNFPYQLGTGHRTNAMDSKVINLDLKDGDVIVVGTDSLFDNLFTSEIVKIVNSSPSTENVARILATETFHRSFSNQSTPFMKEANKLGLTSMSVGGKPDDITILVSRISETE